MDDVAQSGFGGFVPYRDALLDLYTSNLATIIGTIEFKNMLPLSLPPFPTGTGTGGPQGTTTRYTLTLSMQFFRFQ